MDDFYNSQNNSIGGGSKSWYRQVRPFHSSWVIVFLLVLTLLFFSRQLSWESCRNFSEYRLFILLDKVFLKTYRKVQDYLDFWIMIEDRVRLYPKWELDDIMIRKNTLGVTPGSYKIGHSSRSSSIQRSTREKKKKRKERKERKEKERKKI